MLLNNLISDIYYQISTGHHRLPVQKVTVTSLAEAVFTFYSSLVEMAA